MPSFFPTPSPTQPPGTLGRNPFPIPWPLGTGGGWPAPRPTTPSTTTPPATTTPAAANPWLQNLGNLFGGAGTALLSSVLNRPAVPPLTTQMTGIGYAGGTTFPSGFQPTPPDWWEDWQRGLRNTLQQGATPGGVPGSDEIANMWRGLYLGPGVPRSTVGQTPESIAFVQRSGWQQDANGNWVHPQTGATGYFAASGNFVNATANQTYDFGTQALTAGAEPPPQGNYETAEGGPWVAPGDVSARNLTSSVLRDYLQDPWRSGFFNQRQAQAQEAIGAQTNVAARNLRERMGLSPGLTLPFQESQERNIELAGSRANANALLANLGIAEQMRLGAVGPMQAMENEAARRQEFGMAQRQNALIQASARQLQNLQLASGLQPLHMGDVSINQPTSSNVWGDGGVSSGGGPGGAGGGPPPAQDSTGDHGPAPILDPARFGAPEDAAALQAVLDRLYGGASNALLLPDLELLQRGLDDGQFAWEDWMADATAWSGRGLHPPTGAGTPPPAVALPPPPPAEPLGTTPGGGGQRTLFQPRGTSPPPNAAAAQLIQRYGWALGQDGVWRHAATGATGQWDANRQFINLQTGQFFNPASGALSAAPNPLLPPTQYGASGPTPAGGFGPNPAYGPWAMPADMNTPYQGGTYGSRAASSEPWKLFADVPGSPYTRPPSTEDMAFGQWYAAQNFPGSVPNALTRLAAQGPPLPGAPTDWDTIQAARIFNTSNPTPAMIAFIAANIGGD